MKKDKPKKRQNPNKMSVIKASLPDDWTENGEPEVYFVVDQKETMKANRSRTKSETFGPDTVIDDMPNLDNSGGPFCSGDRGRIVDARKSVRRCILAYWSCALLRNLIEIQVELCCGEIKLLGGNKSTKDFLFSWFKKINLWKFSEQWFREFFRAGTTYSFPISGKLTQEDQNKLNKVYGATIKDIPVFFGVLNPEYIVYVPNIDPRLSTYQKVLNPYEVQTIKKLIEKGEITSLSMFYPEELRSLKDGVSNYLTIKPEYLIINGYKTQTYESNGIPIAYGVLKTIETKMELARVDLAMIRTIDRALLHLKVGETPNEWNHTHNVNKGTIAALNDLFSNYSIAKTLVTDYSVEAKWVIPDLGDILSDKKYAQIDKDLILGLNASLFGSGETFANAALKIQMFVQRLGEARKNFIEGFLQPEIEKICEKLNSKSIPKAEFVDFNLKDEIQYAQLASQLAQLGLLTPEEVFNAINTGEFPNIDESLENQRKYKAQREEGLYLPIIGMSTTVQKDQGAQQIEVSRQAKSAQPVGNPKGSKRAKTKVTPSPIGTSKGAFSVKKLTELTNAAANLQDDIIKELKKTKKIKKVDSSLISAAQEITLSLISNEEQKDWNNKISIYLKELPEVNQEAQFEIDDIMIANDATKYQAALLRLCKTEAPKD